MRSYQDYSSAYNKFSNQYNNFANKYNSYGSIFRTQNPWEMTHRTLPGGGARDLGRMIVEANKRDLDSRLEALKPDRSLLDRVFDSLLTANYVSAGFVGGTANKGIGEGFKRAGQGFMAGIGGVFGDGNEKHEYSYSGVLGEMGWNPTSNIGKGTKWVVGFTGDVLLDPTTYLTGGLSAVVKGTGRVGKTAKSVAELGDNAVKVSRENRIDRLLEKGVSLERAEKFADKKMVEDLTKFGNTTHMTEEIAKEIIELDLRKSGVKITETELIRDSKQFANEYNKAVGIYDINGKGITFGVENLPFGDKFAHKLGPLGKTIQLADDKSARAFADKIGISSVYSSVRDGIYGSQIGRLFSTSSSKVNWAHKDPAQLYKIVKAVDAMKGKNVDKLARTKEIKQIARQMNLTPADQKELIKMMEGVNVKEGVRAIMDISETMKFKEQRQLLRDRRNHLQKQYDELNNNLNTLSNGSKKAGKDLTDAGKVTAQTLKELDGEIQRINKDFLTGDFSKAHAEYMESKKSVGSVKVAKKTVESLQKFSAEGLSTIRNQAKVIEDTFGKSMAGQVEAITTMTKRLETLVVEHKKMTGAIKGSATEVQHGRKVDIVGDRLNKEIEKIETKYADIMERHTKSMDEAVQRIETLVNKRDTLTKRVRVRRGQVAPKSMLDVNHEQNRILKGERKIRNEYKERINALNRKLSSMDDLHHAKAGSSYSRKEIDARRNQLNTEIEELSKRVRLSNEAEQARKLREKADQWDFRTYNEVGHQQISKTSEFLTKMPEGSKGFSKLSTKLANDISFYVYGADNLIMPFQQTKKGMDMLNSLLKLIDEHKSPIHLQKQPLLRDAKILSPRAHDTYKLIGSQLGYKDYNTQVVKRIVELEKKGALNANEKLEYANLIDMGQKRAQLLQKYWDMPEAQFRKLADTIAEEQLSLKLTSELSGTGDDFIRYFDDADMSKTDNMYNGAEQIMDDALRHMDKLDKLLGKDFGPQYNDALHKIFERRSRTTTKITDSADYRQVNSKGDLLDVESHQYQFVATLNEMALRKEGMMYSDLPVKFQEQYMKEALGLHTGRMKLSDTETFALGKARNELYKEVQEKAEIWQINKVTDDVSDGMLVKTVDGHMGFVVSKNFSENGVTFETFFPSQKKITTVNPGQIKSYSSKSAFDTGTFLNTSMVQKAIGDRAKLADDLKKLIDERKNLSNPKKITKAELDAKQAPLRAEKEALERLMDERIAQLPKRATVDSGRFKAYERLVNRRDAKNLELRREKYAVGRTTKAYEKEIEPYQKVIQLSKERKDALGSLESTKVEYKRQLDALPKAPDVNMKTLEDIHTRLAKHEQDLEFYSMKQDAFKDTMASMDVESLGKMAEEIDDLEKILASNDALADYMTLKMGEGAIQKIIDKESGFTASMSVIDALPLSKQQREVGKMIRKHFWDVGMQEVQIGKLTRQQFEGMAHRYVYHKATPEYEEFMQATKVENPYATPTQDFGFGVKYSNSSRKRTQTDGITEFNSHMRDILKGKNAFSEDLADIYVTRMLKHEDLMYDHATTQTMMARFGRPITDVSQVEKGFKAVGNYGQIREFIMGDAAKVARQEIKELEKQLESEWKREVKGIASSRMSDMYKRYTDVLTDKDIRDLHRWVGLKNADYNADQITDAVEAILREKITAPHHTGNPVLARGYNRSMADYTKVVENEKRFVGVPKEKVDEIFNKHFETVAEGYGFDAKTFTTEKMPMIELNKAQVETMGHAGMAHQMNSAIVDKANLSRKIKMQKDENALLRSYDKFLHWIKLNQTAIMPAFHGRNKYSNMFQMWLGVGRDAFNPTYQVNAIKTMFHRGNPEKLKDLKPIVDVNGKVHHWHDLYDEAIVHKVVDEGFFAQDLSKMTESKGLFGKFIKPKYDPTSTQSFKPYQIAQNFGANVEGSDRILHFTSMIRQGYSADEAAESAIKFLFDYADLTVFERNVMKRIIPYYTWIRKNSALQIDQLIENPEKYRLTGKVMNSGEKASSEEERVDRFNLPGFAQDWIQTPFTTAGRGKQRNALMLNPGMPFMDLGRLPDPFNPIESIIEQFSAVTPVIKLPTEFALNWNTFFDEQLVKDGESKPKGFAQHTLSLLASYNAIKNVAGSEDTNQMFHFLNTMTGVKFMPYNEQMGFARQMEHMYMEKNREKRIQWFIEDKLDKLGDKAVIASDYVIDGVRDGVIGLTGQPPKRAQDYQGSLRPISEMTYNELSDTEKRKYLPPTKGDALIYNREAKRLEDEQYAKTGVFKKFVWTLLETENNSPQKSVGRITKVQDGDTATVNIGGKETTLRFLLVDTPESVHPTTPEQPGGKKASEFSKSMLFGKDVTLVIQGYDHYGRALAYVELEGEDYNKMLIEEGYAQVRYLDGVRNRKKVAEYFKAEKEAAKKKKGVWQYDDYAVPGKDQDFKPYNVPGW